MEQNRAKLNEETQANSSTGKKEFSSGTAEKRYDTTLSEKVTEAPTGKGSLPLEPSPNVASDIQHLASSASIISSSSVHGNSSTISSASINDNINADFPAPVTKVQEKTITSAEEISDLESIDKEDTSERDIQGNVDISGNVRPCEDKARNIVTMCHPSSNLDENVSFNESATLTKKDVISPEVVMDDMELVSLEDEVQGDILTHNESQEESKLILSHSKSESQLSSEERRAELYIGKSNQFFGKYQSKKDALVDGNIISLPSSESFNDFHYWREPLASVEIEESNDGNTIADFEVLKTTDESSKIPNRYTIEIDKGSEMELDDEIDDQIVLASLTGMTTRSTVDEKKESSLTDLEDFDDFDVMKADDKLKEVEIIDLNTSNILTEDGTELLVEPLANLANKLNIENKMDDQEADGIISGQTLTLSEAENSVDDTKIVTREDTEITETLDSSNIITKMSHNNGKSN